MLFNQKYPEATKHTYEPPHTDRYVEPRLFYCGRVFPCRCANGYTGWRYDYDGMEVLVCSDECLAEFKRDNPDPVIIVKATNG